MSYQFDTRYLSANLGLDNMHNNVRKVRKLTDLLTRKMILWPCINSLQTENLPRIATILSKRKKRKTENYVLTREVISSMIYFPKIDFLECMVTTISSK